MNHNDIWTERVRLQRERMKKRIEIMEPYDRFYDSRLHELQKKCEILGHNFHFSSFNVIGELICICEYCGKREK